MSSLSRPLTICGLLACGAGAAFLAPLPMVRAADDLPNVYVSPIDIDVDIDLGPRRPPRIYDPRGSYAGMPPAYYGREIDRPLVAPDQVAAMLRSAGFSLLGPINRRGWIYTAAAINRRGDDGRVIIDARTGAIIRFLPAFAINERTDRELTTLYGPPGPPPPSADIYRAPRPPANVPKVARRAPSSAPPSSPQAASKPGPAPAPVAAAPARPPLVAAAPEAAKPAEAKPAAAALPSAKPAEVEIRPTQDMPPMQTLE